ncbi:WhiB family transcriptional regulator [Streptomyces sp. NPDC058623]|uniref:WhiB family transcriptional regulator n=1 Tax=Streptomyces sp. NPDC058623 TaxID=3346563 RepID=UPI00364DE663
MPNTSRLPLPLLQHWAWQAEAACRETASEQFFGPTQEPLEQRQERDERAKRICAGCPVAEACLRHALSAQERYGVWGGLTARERSRLQAAA